MKHAPISVQVKRYSEALFGPQKELTKAQFIEKIEENLKTGQAQLPLVLI
jgi:hypothetical protein